MTALKIAVQTVDLRNSLSHQNASSSLIHTYNSWRMTVHNRPVHTHHITSHSRHRKTATAEIIITPKKAI